MYSPEAALLGIEPPAQVERTHVKIELKEKIKTKYNGTELPQIDMKEPEPPKPVSKVQIYAEEMLICALYQCKCINCGRETYGHKAKPFILRAR